VTGDLEAALAFVSRREGLRSMPASRWAHVMSLDLGWMPPGEARVFVSRAVEAALLRDEGEALRLTIDPATVQVPPGFRPGRTDGAPPAARPTAASVGPAVAAPQPPTPIDPFLDWVEKLAKHSGTERRQVLAQVAQVQDRMGGSLSAMAALLWLAAKAGLDVRAAAAAVKL